MPPKIAMVTGANDGIGRATALGLAQQGLQVVMVCRSAARGQIARDEIRRESGNPNVELMVCDLASQTDIRALADEYRRTTQPLHILINNAGVSSEERVLTEDGIELSFAVNHLAPFLLTLLLLDVMKASAPARIVNVTSTAEGFAKIDFDDLMLVRDYSWMRGYAQAKLGNVLFTYELSRRLAGTNVTVNAVNPGAVRTKMTKSLSGFYGWMAWLFQPFAGTPAQGAETSIYLATSDEVQGVSGKFFEKKRPKETSKASYDEALAQQMWDLSTQLTHLGERVSFQKKRAVPFETALVISV